MTENSEQSALKKQAKAGQYSASWWREQCVALLQAEDWYGLYKTAMAWRCDGGAYTPEAWLMDVCSALLHGQPKTATHCCDMALHVWVERPGDRSVLHFVRGLLVADHVGDPRSALDDFTRASQYPAWLRDDAWEEHRRVETSAAKSRVKTPRVRPAPAYDRDYIALISSPASSPRPVVPDPLPIDGIQPELWDYIRPRLRKF